MTTKSAVSRRYLLAAGAASLAMACGGAVPAPSWAAAPGATGRQELIRNWYTAGKNKDWGTAESLMTDDFTFSSAAGDDHISKSAFKTQCWDTQIPLIDRFELELVLDNGNEALVQYVCWTKNGKSIRNVEHLTFKGDKIAAIYCFFGGAAGYPSAADKGNG